MIAAETSLVCKNCRHWHKLGADPMQLGAPPKGECRHSPPAASFVPSQQGLMIVTAYPQPGGDAAACAQYAERMAMVEV